jgi:hypothetical protein
MMVSHFAATSLVCSYYRQKRISLWDTLRSHSRAWLNLIKTNPYAEITTEYLQLWELLKKYNNLYSITSLMSSIACRLTSNKMHSASSAYMFLYVSHIPSTTIDDL